MEYRYVLAHYLDKAGMSQAELAAKIGSPRSTVSALLSGRAKEPTLGKAKAIADALGVSLDEMARKNAWRVIATMAARLRLREARLKYGAKQAEVASILGVSVSSYSMMESGTRTTSGDKIAKLARFYGCSADELLGTGAWEAHDMQLARALNEYIAELGMRQVDVCRKSGLSDAHVSQLFSGKIRDPKVSVVRKVAQAMGISVDDLLDRAESYRE